jgi:hypothetical protein
MPLLLSSVRQDISASNPGALHNSRSAPSLIGSPPPKRGSDSFKSKSPLRILEDGHGPNPFVDAYFAALAPASVLQQRNCSNLVGTGSPNAGSNSSQAQSSSISSQFQSSQQRLLSFSKREAKNIEDSAAEVIPPSMLPPSAYIYEGLGVVNEQLERVLLFPVPVPHSRKQLIYLSHFLTETVNLYILPNPSAVDPVGYIAKTYERLPVQTLKTIVKALLATLHEFCRQVFTVSRERGKVGLQIFQCLTESCTELILRATKGPQRPPRKAKTKDEVLNEMSNLFTQVPDKRDRDSDEEDGIASPANLQSELFWQERDKAHRKQIDELRAKVRSKLHFLCCRCILLMVRMHSFYSTLCLRWPN